MASVTCHTSSSNSPVCSFALSDTMCDAIVPCSTLNHGWAPDRTTREKEPSQLLLTYWLTTWITWLSRYTHIHTFIYDCLSRVWNLWVFLNTPQMVVLRMVPWNHGSVILGTSWSSFKLYPWSKVLCILFYKPLKVTKWWCHGWCISFGAFL